MVWRAAGALPLPSLPEKPVQLHAVRYRANFCATPLFQGSPYLLHSLDSAGSDLHFLLAASWQLLKTVHLQQGFGLLEGDHNMTGSRRETS